MLKKAKNKNIFCFAIEWYLRSVKKLLFQFKDFSSRYQTLNFCFKIFYWDVKGFYGCTDLKISNK